MKKEIEKLDCLISKEKNKEKILFYKKIRSFLIKKIPCKYGEYTNEPFNTHGCITCGIPNTVICSNTNVIGKRRNGNLCNPQNCKYFEHPDLT
jgi:hypothetical protein